MRSFFFLLSGLYCFFGVPCPCNATLTRSLSRRVFILVGAAPLPSSAHLWLPGDRLATLSERRWTSEIPSRDAGSNPHVVLLPEMNQDQKGWASI